MGGTVEGEVEVTGDVEIDDMATVKASLAGRDVSIRGQVNGAVVARKRLVVARSGSLIGDVRVQRLVIQDGATFSGKVSMGAASEAPPKAAEPKPVAAELEAVAAEPVVQAVVEAPTLMPPPISAPPIAPAVATQTRTASKDGKVKAVPPKAASPKAAPPKAPLPKGKPKRR